jgi:hypothetical protein
MGFAGTRAEMLGITFDDLITYLRQALIILTLKGKVICKPEVFG